MPSYSDCCKEDVETDGFRGNINVADDSIEIDSEELDEEEELII
jgi:hypothetical protein